MCGGFFELFLAKDFGASCAEVFFKIRTKSLFSIRYISERKLRCKLRRSSKMKEDKKECAKIRK